ncbi:hypothetical protein [Streptomyces sp. NPDC012616]|uniref:hypothetical protein n=1 Tax=Streptomyces sp. NPDC012616 TaxID=3364840 RepID=UPI0036E49EA1
MGVLRGTYIEMASPLTEPILLGLAVLAVRNRVKRRHQRGTDTSGARPGCQGTRLFRAGHGV